MSNYKQEIADSTPVTFERSEKPPIVQIVNGFIITRPIFKANDLGTDANGDYIFRQCSSQGWTDLQLPEDFTDILFYAATIAWNNGLHPVTALGVPGDGTSLLLGTNGNNVTITSDDLNFPQRYFGNIPPCASSTADPYDQDNSGYYILGIKKYPG